MQNASYLLARHRHQQGCFVDTIEDSLLKQLGEKFGGRPKLNDSLALIGVDSVGMAELTFEIEKSYGFRVDDEILDVDTVQELANYIRRRIGRAAG